MLSCLGGSTCPREDTSCYNAGRLQDGDQRKDSEICYVLCVWILKSHNAITFKIQLILQLTDERGGPHCGWIEEELRVAGLGGVAREPPHAHRHHPLAPPLRLHAQKAALAEKVTSGPSLGRILIFGFRQRRVKPLWRPLMRENGVKKNWDVFAGRRRRGKRKMALQ